VTYLYNVAIWLDQGLNVLFCGSPDETLSARAERQAQKGNVVPKTIINAIFFWQDDHCHAAWLSEVNRKQLPRDYQ
jgi:hypothetical protein